MAKFSHQFTHRPSQVLRWSPSNPSPVVVDVAIGEDRTVEPLVSVHGGEVTVVVEEAPITVEIPVTLEVPVEIVLEEVAVEEAVAEVAVEETVIEVIAEETSAPTKNEILAMRKLELIELAAKEGLEIDESVRKDVLAATLLKHFNLG